MKNIITDIQREVVVNTANINQLQLDLDNIKKSITIILALTNDITCEVEDIQKHLQYLRERIHF